MDTIPYKHVASVVSALLRSGSRRAVKFVAPGTVVRATRTLYKGRIGRKNSNVEVVLTIGRPNYVERVFVRDCIAAGEPFPIKRVQLQSLPKRRGA